MWWFLNKSRPAAKPALNSARELAAEGLLHSVADMSRLTNHEIAIKVWLPERVAQAMKWLADYEGVSQSEWTRQHLTTYVYGSVAVLAQKIRDERGVFDGPMFSRTGVDRNAGRWVYLVPQLGKNTVAFKVWVSQQLRDDLEILAKHAGVGLSPFIREALVGQLLGRGSLPELPEILGAATAEALAWERGEEVPYDHVEESTFSGLGDYETAWVPDEPETTDTA